MTSASVPGGTNFACLGQVMDGNRVVDGRIYGMGFDPVTGTQQIVSFATDGSDRRVVTDACSGCTVFDFAVGSTAAYFVEREGSIYSLKRRGGAAVAAAGGPKPGATR